jgi:hypothetical protein
LEGFFWHGDPEWLVMIKAYLDESFDDPRNQYVIVGGHCGNEEAWDKFVPNWNLQLGNQRKRLHMVDLRWKNPSTKRLLERLGPVPAESGLSRVICGAKVADYEDLLEQSPIEKAWLKTMCSGYMLSLVHLVTTLLHKLPDDETLEVTLERQKEYEPWAEKAMGWILDLPQPRLLTKERW